MIKISKCLKCKNIIDECSMIPKCKEYKKGIPMKFFREEIKCKKHREGEFFLK